MTQSLACNICKISRVLDDLKKLGMEGIIAEVPPDPVLSFQPWVPRNLWEDPIDRLPIAPPSVGAFCLV